eukprot:TRINITY_DN6153_c0_g2_i1.p1 TRINITY_DN6153_c0_g2~~TRINITY_DN6153_c0_g2_i1.p1  ORF type:complete len:302 (-),score=66.50 TRINITY_DN6153_c0_g2_i1:17-922(-)
MEDTDPIQVPGANLPLQMVSDSDQLKAVDALYDIIQADDSISQIYKDWSDKDTVYRYLRARNWKLDAAEEMLRNTLKWRDEFKPHELTAEELKSQITAGHMYQYGFDKWKRPVVYLKVHQKEDPHTPLQKMQFMIHCLEYTSNIMDAERGVSKMVWIVDCNGYNMKHNGEIGFARELLNVLQSHFPERLGILFLSDAPFVFRAMWKVVSPFIDQTTLKKVVFLTGGLGKGSEKRKVMKEFFEISDLPEAFGGKLEVQFDSDEYMARIQNFEKQLLEKNSPKTNGSEQKQKKKKKKKKKQSS